MHSVLDRVVLVSDNNSFWWCLLTPMVGTTAFITCLYKTLFVHVYSLSHSLMFILVSHSLCSHIHTHLLPSFSATLAFRSRGLPNWKGQTTAKVDSYATSAHLVYCQWSWHSHMETRGPIELQQQHNPMAL